MALCRSGNASACSRDVTRSGLTEHSGSRDSIWRSVDETRGAVTYCWVDNSIPELLMLTALPFFFALLACDTADEADDVPQTPDDDVIADTAAPETLDLDLDGAGNREAFARVRGSLDEDEQVYFYWSGYIYDHQDADPYDPAQTDWGSPILQFEGFNVARFQKAGNGTYDMLTREVSVYRNLNGEIIDCWNNSALGAEEAEDVRVVHVQNDPVNFQVGGADYIELDDTIAFRMEVLLAYPSSLPVDDYPEYSAGNTYQSVELFNFYADRADLEDPDQLSVPAHISWSRFGQYLPWMKMGQRPGKLVYHVQGYKVMEGWEGLPQDLREWVEENAPEHQDAPEFWGWGDNMTSWRYFESLVSDGEYDSSCP